MKKKERARPVVLAEGRKRKEKGRKRVEMDCRGLIDHGLANCREWIERATE